MKVLFLHLDNKEVTNVVNTNEAFCSVIRTRLAGHSILIGAEVDCQTKNHKLKPPSNYIELKTSRIMYNNKHKQNFAKFKLKKFWAQSFLAGVPKVTVGLRNDNGVVTSLEHYDTLNIPNVCRQYTSDWEPNVCLNFLNQFLNWLKKTVVLDGPNIAYILDFEYPFIEVKVNVVKDGSERFLPQWYTD